MAAPIREQLRATLAADSAVTALVPPERILTRRLVRPGSLSAEDIGEEETPEAFSPDPPFPLLPTIVVGTVLGRTPEPSVRSTLATRWVVTLAYYVPPDQLDQLEVISTVVSVAIDRTSVMLPRRGGRVVLLDDVTGSYPVPEFPGAGFVMLERVGIAAIRPRKG